MACVTGRIYTLGLYSVCEGLKCQTEFGQLKHRPRSHIYSFSFLFFSFLFSFSFGGQFIFISLWVNLVKRNYSSFTSNRTQLWLISFLWHTSSFWFSSALRWCHALFLIQKNLILTLFFVVVVDLFFYDATWIYIYRYIPHFLNLFQLSHIGFLPLNSLPKLLLMFQFILFYLLHYYFY